MKNVLLLLLVGVCVYQYMSPQTVVVTKEVRVPVPARTAYQGARMFYHSPLDAPAMPVSYSTGMGYFSTDVNSRFVASGATSSTRATSGGGYSAPRPVAPVVDSTNPLASVDMLQTKLSEQP